AGLTEALSESKLIKEQDTLEALSLIYSIPFFETLFPKVTDSAENLIDTFTKDISIGFFKKFCLVPLIKKDSQATLAINDPSELSCIDDVVRLLGLEHYKLVLAPKEIIHSVINILYNRTRDDAQQIVDDIEDSGSSIIEEIKKTADLLDDTNDAPVIKLVNHMISQGVKTGASDIHIEPYQETLIVRYRIDGILYEMLSLPKQIQSALVSRIKVMADMNIAEKMIPQDGRFEVKIGGDRIDIRLSTIPVSFGERVVMRLLNKSGYFLELSEFNLSKDNYDLLLEIINQHNGIVLVTGPTGSGKTTTLYAALSKINSSDKNIITIEDPVEYNISGIGQIQVNRKKNVTFAKGLRSIVRQDPDIVLVGEIRDLETAEIAIQSALTGHLVFSTLHTNDSAGAITRMVDLGIEPYLLSSSVQAVIAQRLVRVLCEECKQDFFPEQKDVANLNSTGKILLGEKIYKAKGCEKCFNTGYQGRQPIFEIMVVDDVLKEAILTTSDSNKIKDTAVNQGMVSLRNDGMIKVLNGITTINEVLRVTQD
ncbi:MAG: type II secretion system ATPase GspE, partial [Desulfobacteraceae bacterium]|nr:type II secretion system ATPase GspE [Desulfobacteraceae bacterium]